MTTERQVTANQGNAQLSTGPSTPAGKAVSRRNALKQGLRAETAVLPGEDAGDYRAFRQALVDQLDPAGELEAVPWRLRRAGHVEAGLFRRKHHDRFVKAAMNRANSCRRSEMQDLLDDLDGKVTDQEAHDQAVREADEARALRDAEPNAVAAAFE